MVLSSEEESGVDDGGVTLHSWIILKVEKEDACEIWNGKMILNWICRERTFFFPQMLVAIFRQLNPRPFKKKKRMRNIFSNK